MNGLGMFSWARRLSIWSVTSFLIQTSCTGRNPRYRPAQLLDDGGAQGDATMGGSGGADHAGGIDGSALDGAVADLASELIAGPDSSAPDGLDNGDLLGTRDFGADALDPVQVELTSNLVGYWKMDDSAGSAVAKDSSGNLNHGAIVGLNPATAWVSGHKGGSLDIPYVQNEAVPRGARVTPSRSIDAIATLTIAAWVWRTMDISIHTCVLSRQLGSENDGIYNLGFNAGEATFYIAPTPGGSAASHMITAGHAIPLAQWVHVAATYDGATMRLYENGAEVSSLPYTQPLPATTNPLYLGNNVNAANNVDPLGGRLDEVMLYARALSPAAIAALAKDVTPRGF